MSHNLNTRATSPERAFASIDSPIAILPSDVVVSLNADGGNLTANLPALATVRGRLLCVFIVSSADLNTLDPNGAETINGGANYPVDSSLGSQGILIYAPPTGTDWFVLSQTFI